MANDESDLIFILV